MFNLSSLWKELSHCNLYFWKRYALSILIISVEELFTSNLIQSAVILKMKDFKMHMSILSGTTYLILIDRGWVVSLYLKHTAFLFSAVYQVQVPYPGPHVLSWTPIIGMIWSGGFSASIWDQCQSSIMR